MTYEFIKSLKVEKERAQDWYKLKWRPIKTTDSKDGTWNMWVAKYTPLLGLRWYANNADNGWGRRWNEVHVEIGFGFFTICGWIRWNIVVHKDGPMDGYERVPLDLMGVNK
jgi:hypothetical protein